MPVSTKHDWLNKIYCGLRSVDIARAGQDLHTSVTAVLLGRIHRKSVCLIRTSFEAWLDKKACLKHENAFQK